MSVAVKMGRLRSESTVTPNRPAARPAKKNAYARLVKRTSSMGAMDHAQNVGEKAMPEISPMRPMGTPRAASKMPKAVLINP